MTKGSKRHKGGKRKNKQRALKPAFYIFCEGKNTEPLYFNSFNLSNIAYCKGNGETKLKLVETALKHKKSNSAIIEIDEYWVVFDYDFDGNKQPKQKEDFNNAILKAEKNGINCAVPNDAFELWFVLHFEKCESKELRNWYNKRIGKHLNIKYSKDKSIALKIYDLLLQNQEKAIERATKLNDQYDERNNSYADKNPLTTVYKLVKELNKYLE